MEQYHNQWHRNAEQPFYNIGRANYPENVYVSPMDNMLTNGVHYVSQWNLGSRPVEHSLSSARLEGSLDQAAVSGISYERFPPFMPAGSFNVGPETIAGRFQPSFYNRHTSLEVGGSSLDPSMGVGRRQCKRKRPAISAAFERSSVAGGSFNQSWHEKRNLGYHDYTSSSSSVPHYRSGILSVGGEDSSRNVRSRSRLDLSPNHRRSDLPSYYSNHCYPVNHLRNHTESWTLTNLNANGAAREQNHSMVFPAAHGMFLGSENRGLNHEMNHLMIGDGTEIDGYYHDPIRSNHVSHPHFYGVHAQVVREGPYYYPHSASSYRADLSYPCSRESFPSENVLQFPSETYSSRYARPLCARRRSFYNYRDGRSRIATERFQSLSNVAERFVRLETEAYTRANQASLFSSRYMFDQHQEMRLDIDNMSYEELLALGERIGSVGTGLSEDAIVECLETKHCSSDHLQEAATCTICLEDYKNKEEVRTLKNCGHDYHGSCIKNWLAIKNVCPICKRPALSNIADSFKEK